MSDSTAPTHHTIVTPDHKQKEVEAPQTESSRTGVEDSTSSQTMTDRLDSIMTPRKTPLVKPLHGSDSPTSKRGFKRWMIPVIVVLVILLLVGGTGGVVAFRTYQVAMGLKQQAMETATVGRSIIDNLKGQNLPAAEAALVDVQGRMDRMKQDYQKLAFYNNFPIAKNYYQDGLHGFAAAEAGLKAGSKSLEAIVPYADVLGFAGEGTFTGGTAENRIKLLLETLSKVSPVLDGIAADLATAETELAQINPNRYPEQIQGQQLRSNIIQAQEGIKGANTALTEFRPVIEVLPEIAGSETRKKYLVIFQNDNELRPTGGFMTAYAVLFMEDGKVSPEKSDDIYELDKKFRKNIPIPEALGRYLTTEKRWNLRDMNVSPDFKVSMDEFYKHFQEVPGEPANIDGIISVDTNVLTELVRVLGPVEVPDYGTFSAENDARCDCPQIIYVLSEIVDRPTPYLREDRKGIIAPMMQAILQKAYSAPKELWPQLMQLGLKKIEGRHVQFYMFDEEHQLAAEKVKAAGRMDMPEEGSDYLAVVDSNLGGAKSNLFVQTEGKLEVPAPADGKLTNKLTLKYKNDRKGDNCNLEAGQLCLNGTLRDWIRIYLPKGAKMVNTNGFDEGTVRESEELGFSVIEGSFRLAPLAQATIQVEYTVPYNATDKYKLYMRKQAGADAWKYLLDINGHEEEITLDKDQKIEIEF